VAVVVVVSAAVLEALVVVEAAAVEPDVVFNETQISETKCTEI
jgi:hypothetical protein